MKTKKITTKLTATFAVALVVATNAAYAQELVNGSFESGVDPNLDLVEHSIVLTAPDTTSLPGWTVSGGTVDYIGTRWLAGDGMRCLDLAGITPGTISQSVGGFTLGGSYQLSFLMAASPEGGELIQGVRVGIGSLSQAFSATGFGTRNNLGWTERTLDFTATAPCMPLSFASLDSTVYGPALDGVRIVAVPGPEVCPFWLSALAFGTFAARQTLRPVKR